MTFGRSISKDEERCRADFTQIEMALFDRDTLPKLMTAEQASKEVYIPADRLIELADADLAPCVRIDGGVPLFYKKDIVRWVGKFAAQIQKGRCISDRFKIVRSVPDAAYDEIPEPLKPLQGQLKSYTNQWYPPCVYFLIDDGEIVYVGQTTSLPQRIQVHLKEKPGSFDEILYLPVPKGELDAAEQAFIRTLRPMLNRACVESEPNENHISILHSFGISHDSISPHKDAV